MTPEWKANMIAGLKGRKLRPEEIARRSKQVICLTDMKVFLSCNEAAKHYGVGQAVSRCCRDGKERSGLRFAFVGIPTL